VGDFINLKSKDSRHGKIRKDEEVIKHKSDHKNYKYISISDLGNELYTAF
jgi:hypothetical protein